MRPVENGVHGGGVTVRRCVADNVDGIGARPGCGEHCIELGDKLVAELDQGSAGLDEVVHGKHAGAAAIGHDQKLIARDRLQAGQGLCCREEVFEVVDAYQPCAAESRLHRCVAARKRAGMGRRGSRRGFAPS